MNIHTAVFVDTLNTSPGKISHTNWGNSASGSWGSVKINRTYLVGSKNVKTMNQQLVLINNGH